MRSCIIAVLLAALLVLCGCSLISGCDAGHDRDGGILTAATCESAGKMTYTCTRCGTPHTETVSAKRWRRPNERNLTFFTDPIENLYCFPDLPPV